MKKQELITLLNNLHKVKLDKAKYTVESLKTAIQTGKMPVMKDPIKGKIAAQWDQMTTKQQNEYKTGYYKIKKSNSTKTKSTSSSSKTALISQLNTIHGVKLNKAKYTVESLKTAIQTGKMPVMKDPIKGKIAAQWDQMTHEQRDKYIKDYEKVQKVKKAK